ncbi:uncharacterized protein LOC129966722 isoform X3 [Argiope bruennichi]|uniref:uncharacterized protein LOC129966722 isoform X3 n=1 Tax=Argiope bruennichi TaxID=94029 RepID=UPI0024948A4B|nr:uncharacterized protein LOC129966722 isoform X3 [Argiope bruennichi]XP_055937230.1 uncharacterized protein LOC129966722 isoform X3 [Argiope bruennichi]
MEISTNNVSKITEVVESITNMPPTACKKTPWWHIDREMLHFKLHFFLLSGALGAVFPFIGVFAKERLRLSASSFASVITVQQFLFVLSKPALGFIADYFNKLKVILLVLVIAQTGFFFLLLLVPPLPKGDNNVADGNGSIINFSMQNFDTCYFYNFMDDRRHDGCVVSLNYTTINSSVQTVDACNFCNLLNDPSNISNVSLKYTSIPKDIYFKQVCEKCNVVEEMSFNNVKKCVKIIIPLDCNQFKNSSSVKSENNEDLFEKYFELNNNENSTNFISCKNLSKIFCGASFDYCFRCCNLEEGCYFIPNNTERGATNPNITRKDISIQSDFTTYQFWSFAILFVALSACVHSIFTLSDTACCESVERTGAEFGKQRLWGCIAWGLFAPLGGFLNDYTGSYIVIWILFVILSCLALWNITKLGIVKPRISMHIMKDIRTIISSWEFICFEMAVLLAGVGLGFTFFYLIWFIKSIGGTSLLCGLIETVQSFTGDIPFMFFSEWMLRKLGYFNIVTLSLLASCIRFLWYSQLENPWLVLPIEWAHGLTYGLFYAAMASFAKMSAKPGTETTTQSVIFATFDGLGSGIGNIIAGVGFDYVGGHTMFLCTGAVFGCAAVLSAIGTFICKNRVNHIKK